jgi:hypothetical protein
MRFVVPIVLVLVAAIHSLPIAGVLGASKLTQLYGVTVHDPNLELLLRHRAVLFGLLAALMAYAAFRPELHRVGLLAGLASTVSFLVLAHPVGALSAGLITVMRADWFATILLVIASAVHFKR